MDKTPLYDADDKVFKDATGKGLQEWVDILDEWEAIDKGHTLMSLYLQKDFKLDPKWAEAVSIRYQKDNLL
jgi:hypothetical protein